MTKRSEEVADLLKALWLIVVAGAFAIGAIGGCAWIWRQV